MKRNYVDPTVIVKLRAMSILVEVELHNYICRNNFEINNFEVYLLRP